MDKKIDMFVSDIQAAKAGDLSPQTLRNWRYQRKGPVYYKIGRSVRYKIKDLIEFFEDRKIDPRN